MKTTWSILLPLICFSCLSCSQDDIENDVIDLISITYQAMNNINDQKLLKDKIHYDDIIGYDSIKYAFLLSQSASDKINSYFFKAGGMPFSLEVSGDTIYSGLFFPSYSSNTPCGYIVEPVIGSNNIMVVRLDYGLCPNEIEDNRNDPHLIERLEQDNKILELE